MDSKLLPRHQCWEGPRRVLKVTHMTLKTNNLNMFATNFNHKTSERKLFLNMKKFFCYHYITISVVCVLHER